MELQKMNTLQKKSLNNALYQGQEICPAKQQRYFKTKKKKKQFVDTINI